MVGGFLTVTGVPLHLAQAADTGRSSRPAAAVAASAGQTLPRQTYDGKRSQNPGKNDKTQKALRATESDLSVEFAVS
jgi:hypothetical protein